LNIGFGTTARARGVRRSLQTGSR